jgi:hypothetical protein
LVTENRFDWTWLAIHVRISTLRFDPKASFAAFDLHFKLPMRLFRNVSVIEQTLHEPPRIAGPTEAAYAPDCAVDAQVRLWQSPPGSGVVAGGGG